MEQIPTPFLRFSFSTQEEEERSHILSPEVYAKLHNMRTEYLLQLTALKFDTTNPIEYGLAKAELQGQVSVLDLLINEHLEALQRARAFISAQRGDEGYQQEQQWQ